MALRGPHLVALAILAGIGGWMLTGKLIEGGQADPNSQTVAEREKEKTADVFRVRYTTVTPSQRPTNLMIRGRTEASANVTVRAETGGNVQKTSFVKGQTITKGDLLCTIDEGIRSTNLAQAQTALDLAQEDFSANEKLAERGFVTKSRLRSLKAALDAAKATLAAAKQDMRRTDIVATSSGQIVEPFAETGDNLAPGGVCATLVQMNPMLFTGQVPEREVGAVFENMPVSVKMISGETATGNVRFIAPAADPQTRTFEVEVALENDDQKLRDGMTATAAIPLPPVSAYKLDANWLTLNNEGQIGVRAVEQDNFVSFVPVTMLAQEADGVWVRGLKPGMRVITLGQNYVAAGEKVDPVPERPVGEERETDEASS